MAEGQVKKALCKRELQVQLLEVLLRKSGQGSAGGVLSTPVGVLTAETQSRVWGVSQPPPSL